MGKNNLYQILAKYKYNAIIANTYKGRKTTRGFPLKIIIGYLLSSYSVGSMANEGALTIVLLLLPLQFAHSVLKKVFPS